MIWANDFATAVRRNKPWAFMLAADVIIVGLLCVDRFGRDYPNIHIHISW